MALVSAAAWMTYTGLQARDDLQIAADEISQVRSAVLSGRLDEAEAALVIAQDRARSARDATNDLVWRTAGAVPVLGNSAEVISTSTDAVATIADTALPSVAAVAPLLDAGSLRIDGGVQVDVDALSKAAPALTTAAAVTSEQAQRLEELPRTAVPQQLLTRVDDAAAQVSELAAVTDDAAKAARIAPRLLGAEGVKRYFLGVESPAESRGNGGLLGAYAIVRADQGRITIETIGSRSALDAFGTQKPTLDFGADYASLWGSDPGLPVNMNLSPHFPYAGALWRDLGQRADLGPLDGALRVDAAALAGLLRVTGPATLRSGDVVTADSLVRLVTKDVYRLIPDDDAARDRYLIEVARGVLASVLGGSGDARAWVDALGSAVQDRRVLAWFADEEAQREIEQTPLAGALGSSEGLAEGPFAMVVVNNAAATKLDAYLDRAVTYEAPSCAPEGGRRSSTLTVTLTNDAPPALPDYVTGRGIGSSRGDGKGGNVLDVSMYLTPGAELVSATLDGERTTLTVGREQGHPVVGRRVALERGESATLTLALSEPVLAGTPRVEVQPLVRAQETSIRWVPCS